ncbi:MAG: prolipoprotein diacylglyceryl transferase [Ruminococcus sp.]|jgi:phosphatidylglycerol:prolipoprotein diacylglycerol transferase|nr:prolipoprotein diacylglyceryl transferase [Ruminococcus sp.]
MNIVEFPKLGWSFDINPEAFKIFGLSFRWYAIIIAVGLWLAVTYCFPKIRKNGIDDDKAFDCILAGVIGAIIGARVYYVIMTLDEYEWTIGRFFSYRQGGLAIYGGIIGAVLFAYIMARIRKIKFIPLLDIAASGFFLGQCIGRWGNFFNQEAFGSNTDLPWGMSSQRIYNYLMYNQSSIFAETGVWVQPEMPVHPTFLYESLWCLIGFLILHFFSKRRKFDGECILFYCLWYGTGRAFIEGLRTDSLMMGGMRASQVLAIITAAAALVLIIVLRQRAIKNNIPLYKDTEIGKATTAECIRRDEEEKELTAKRKAEKKALKEKAQTLKAEEKIVMDDEPSENEEIEENDKSE